MKREDLLIIDGPDYPAGMVDELNAIIQNNLTICNFDEMPEIKQTVVASIVMRQFHKAREAA